MNIKDLIIINDSSTNSFRIEKDFHEDEDMTASVSSPISESVELLLRQKSQQEVDALVEKERQRVQKRMEEKKKAEALATEEELKQIAIRKSKSRIARIRYFESLNDNPEKMKKYLQKQQARKDKLYSDPDAVLMHRIKQKISRENQMKKMKEEGTLERYRIQAQEKMLQKLLNSNKSNK